jgi:hypothetical protein
VWHGHLAREKRAISQETPQGITGKMPVPRYFATPLGSVFPFLPLTEGATVCSVWRGQKTPGSGQDGGFTASLRTTALRLGVFADNWDRNNIVIE